ncbi:hypothetical protein C471_10540 [Halorubrum saccharovorum DSM 1137]|uniref:Uncharacterized protein n=1 Tax=Halorubrum saccharovorum DSM 1137 TaxID=1227484 RepID=M0DUL0_9EURY|nr:hypothetical protein C471_10540 [Halorubrum saccharovorum DSM 1137]
MTVRNSIPMFAPLRSVGKPGCGTVVTRFDTVAA